MAAKKTAKKNTKTTLPAAPETPAPVAKKAAKEVTKKATTSPKKAAATLPAAPKATSKPSADTVARAAYLNYRKRVEQGLPGDSHTDWLEAERQLSNG